MAKRRRKAEIVGILKAIEKQRANGVPLADCCKTQGVSEQSYYRWRSAMASEKDDTARRLLEVTAEAERLKQVLAEVMLDNKMLRDIAQKKW